MSERPRYHDGAGWEREAGYARAARHGRRISVSGTTSNGPDGAVAFPGDTHAQTRHALTLALKAIAVLGGQAADVIRTRVYLAPGADWQAAARAHREVLGEISPANTMLYVGGLIGDGYLVEVEVDAELAGDGWDEGARRDAGA
jgi:enamine deaminase RidA (YjgF/YER057c/UK114 family)